MTTQAPDAPETRTSWLTTGTAELVELNARSGWSLDAPELSAIQKHFKSLRREPTLAEIETIAQTWSEHCKHKTFTSPVRYTEGRTVKLFKNLLAETVKAATRKLKKSWCLSVFEDNAGVVQFDKDWALAYKVETHNHPCGIEPYGGAETGVGGVVRDVLGAGLGAKPVMNTDVFCFCPPDHSAPLPEGVLHPRRTMTGVVNGVRDYGNRMGIPTAAGAIWFDEDYRFNPLVFVGTLGLMPAGAVRKGVAPKDLIAAVGGRTGRDGLHGATFSSAALSEDSTVAAVQVGHAIMEKRVLDALLKARDLKLYRGVTDCGAGGFSSAIGEMAEASGSKGGARVRLEAAALKTSDLAPWEIWLSESQERMVLSVPPENLKELSAVFEAEGVEVSVLGEFTNTGRLEVEHEGRPLVDLDLAFLHGGLPKRERVASWSPPQRPARKGASRSAHKGKAAAILRFALGHLNVCSREWVIRQYDHEVQSGTVIKPLQGLHHDGPGDATVIWPAAVTGNGDSFRGFAVAHGINPGYGKIDPYAMALNCVDEALSNLVCVGADVSKASLLDNFCWGDPEDPAALGGLVRAAKGCHDASIGFQAPFISGKDSFHNVYTDSKTGEKHSIPGTLLISATAPVPDIRGALTMDLKTPGSAVYLVGWTSDELGGSLYEEWSEQPEGQVPSVELRSAKDTLWTLSAAARKGLLASAHNLSEGGLAVAAAEMALAGGIGLDIDLDEVPRTKDAHDAVTILFSESPSRFLLEVTRENEKAFLRAMKGIPMAKIGATIANPLLRVTGLDAGLVMEESLHDLKDIWTRTLPQMLDGGENGSGRRRK